MTKIYKYMISIFFSFVKRKGLTIVLENDIIIKVKSKYKGSFERLRGSIVLRPIT